MELTQLIQLAKQKGVSHALDPSLVCAICEQESEWNVWAIRYELEFDKKYVAPHSFARTEEIARSTSWGLMQLMGETAREIGFIQSLPSLCDPFTGLEWGCRFLAQKLSLAKGDTNKALLLWNGGGNPDYPQQVVNRISKYK